MTLEDNFTVTVMNTVKERQKKREIYHENFQI